MCCVQFLESMQLNYNSQAAENGVYVIGSCGFDSIPADMGVLYTRDQFKGMNTRVHSGIDDETPSDPLSQADGGVFSLVSPCSLLSVYLQVY